MSTAKDRIDDYIERLNRELQTSPQEAQDVLREIRSHLELAVREMGCSGEEASICVTRTLERFGTAKHIGQELRHVHGRASWTDAGLAALPLLLFGSLAAASGPLVGIPALPVIAVPLLFAVITTLAWRAHWPLWWWAWLGWLPLAISGISGDLLWIVIAYTVILLLVSRRDWLEATLSLYPLPTAWAFHRMVLTSGEVRAVGWSAPAQTILGLVMALAWAVLLVRTLRTPSRLARITRVLEGQGIVFVLNVMTIAVARLWPTYPYPYPFTLRHFVFTTLPYALYHGLPFLLFFVLTSLPSVLALIQARTRHRPPSRPIWSN
jgi:hypothetical protein